MIVDDGSTDQTNEIVKRYVSQHSWIRYIHRQRDPSQSYYSSNVYAILEGMKYVDRLDYHYIAILDADISLPPTYYHDILSRFEKDEKLGIASGVYVDRISDNRQRKVLNDRRSTPKALMVFRKECYEAIGAFVPMKYGGEDTCACFMARMKGWKTWSFPDLLAIHNKPVGTGHSRSLLKIRFRLGIGEYFMGTHPLFALAKSCRRCFKEPPYLVGGCLRLLGFIYAHFMREKCQISDELKHYIRKEQMERLTCRNKIPIKLCVDDPCQKY